MSERTILFILCFALGILLGATGVTTWHFWAAVFVVASFLARVWERRA